MKKAYIYLLAVLFLCSSFGETASAQNKASGNRAALPKLSVDEIIARNLKARGGYEALKAIKTLVYSKGTYHEDDFTGSGNSSMAFMRPYFRVVGDPASSNPYIMEGYDGSSWEWYADPGVTVRTVGAASGATRRGADFEGTFVDYKAKGNRIVQGPPTLIAGKPAYQLIVTLPDNFSRSYFFDAQSFLLIADRYIAPFHAYGGAVKTESRFDDFRPVAGVLFSFHGSEVNIANGKVLSEMRWGSIEANRELPKSWFSPPQIEKSLLQQFLENLYYTRTDAVAMMWSYDQFRRTYKDIDTGHGIEFISYQMLKMGEKQSALTLLKANASAYPQSPTAAFGLGRAFEANGKKAQARIEYERALKLDPKYKRAADALANLGR